MCPWISRNTGAGCVSSVRVSLCNRALLLPCGLSTFDFDQRCAISCCCCCRCFAAHALPLRSGLLATLRALIARGCGNYMYAHI